MIENNDLTASERKLHNSLKKIVDHIAEMREAIFSLNLPEFLKVKDLAIFCLRTYPDSWGLIRGELSPKSLKRFANWGIAWNGVCITAPIIFPKSEREYILQDVLEIIVPAKYWLSEEATAKIAGKLSS